MIRKIPSLNELSGSFGEWLAKMYSKTLPGVLVLHDILINGADGYTSQIDLILIGNKGVYVVEVKMFEGAKVYGNTERTNWNYYKHGKKYEIYSPIRQNKKHISYLKSFLAPFGEIPFFSVVTMICDDFKITGNRDENTVVCNSLPAMERGIVEIAEGKPMVLSNQQKEEIFAYIQNNQHIGKEARLEHKQNVKAYKAHLADSKADKICPYCKTELVLRNGKNGPFYGCKNFPRCRYTSPL